MDPKLNFSSAYHP
jgi:hypothetical protein